VGAGDGRQRRSIEGGGAAVSGSRIEFVGTTFDGGIEREIEVGGVLIAPGFIAPDALVALDTTVPGFDNQTASLGIPVIRVTDRPGENKVTAGNSLNQKPDEMLKAAGAIEPGADQEARI
jgi:cytosine/adenosine deaminase-related metal-dependent hydrolase